MTTLFLSFLAGLITMFNPCVLPLAPVVVAGARAEDVRGPLALAAGLAVTFGVVGGLVSAFGAEIGAIAAIRLPASILMVVIGLALIVPFISHAAERLIEPVSRMANTLTSRMSAAGLFGQFLLGALLALVWAPCVGPTLGAAIVLAARTGTLPLAILNMMIYALGTATSLLIAGFIVRKISTGARKAAGRSAIAGRMAFGAILVFIGVISVTGFDEHIQSAIDNRLPTWFVSFVTRL